MLQFSLSRTALSTSGCAKSEFHSVSLYVEFGQPIVVPVAHDTL
jgi:hypothetical protein